MESENVCLILEDASGKVQGIINKNHRYAAKHFNKSMILTIFANQG